MSRYDAYEIAWKGLEQTRRCDERKGLERRGNCKEASRRELAQYRIADKRTGVERSGIETEWKRSVRKRTDLAKK